LELRLAATPMELTLGVDQRLVRPDRSHEQSRKPGLTALLDCRRGINNLEAVSVAGLSP
jgi:hypothetical protein